MVADNSINDSKQSKSTDSVPKRESPEVIHSIPQYGIVQWRDAVGCRKQKLRIDRLTKNLPLRESLGWLFADAEGTIVVIHDHVLEYDGSLRRDVEYTLIPKSWVVSIIPLELSKASSASARGQTSNSQPVVDPQTERDEPTPE